jgi:hypothetical protein
MSFRLLLVSLFFVTAAHAADIPRPEHPRPDFQRDKWMNLNGPWEFSEGEEADTEKHLSEAPYPETIVVPFSREASASGIGRTKPVPHVWYRRTFTMPETWDAPRTLLHVGACDWFTEVWVNGVSVGTHKGGQASFSFDTTDALVSGENTIVVHAVDDMVGGRQVLGKQSRTGKPHDIFFTPTTGIWQTVWLEGVAETRIEGFQITPIPDQGAVLCEVNVAGPTRGLSLTATAYNDAAIAGKGGARRMTAHNKIIIALRDKRLWTLDDPFLYGLRFSIARGEETLDEVQTYFGLRDVRVEGNAILVNGAPVFQRLALDQGFYPEGNWAAPKDDFFKEDIERAKAAGFNGVRLHQKVFDPRYLYWADKLGFLVWGEFPSYGANYGDPSVALPVINEWRAVLQRDRNHPAIVGWCPFNETPPEAAPLQQAIVALTREMDPTRPVIESSGWTQSVAAPEVLDAHDYEQDAARFTARWNNPLSRGEVVLPEPWQHFPHAGVPSFVSEYGAGFWGSENPKHLDPEAFLERFTALTRPLMRNPQFFGFCFTELYDIAHERCGIYTFDRQPKIDPARVRMVLSDEAVYENAPPLDWNSTPTHDWTVAIGGGLVENPGTVRYTTDEPAADWMEPGFDDSAWSTGPLPLGAREGKPRDDANTLWRDDALFARTTFTWEGAPFDVAALVARWDDNATVWLNGKVIWHGGFWASDYSPFDATDAVREALVEGVNVLSVRVRQKGGNQFMDFALLLGREE